MTSVSAGAYADMPLVLLHLAEYLDVDYELDVAEINDRWARTAALDEWSQLVIKETREDVELLTSAPRTGVWRLDSSGRAAFARRGQRLARDLATRARRSTSQVLGAGEYRYPGRTSGLLVGSLADADGGQRADAEGAGVDRGDPGQFDGSLLEPSVGRGTPARRVGVQGVNGSRVGRWSAPKAPRFWGRGS